MGDGFRVDLAALKDAAGGVSGTLEQASRRKVSDIDCDKQSVGHDRLADTVEDFCTRWSLGVENLARDAQEISGRLTECVTVYEELDQGAQDRFNKILQGMGEDPAAR
ncbi:hypothetical protein SAMN05421805_102248 [Saccharopolyspora antimicrobica]|uniref:Excreted virulence factor EspC, type VII ESX diderm n=1 Tax=Saccharopolyspora antimicrobica TaxID=455193 RepID=A0A1I4VKB1_9PSEU|nr:hypothetical protein [Saccharopolyspora antimicrobica]RKT86352.1 hypothetical protein ATL45_4717 [Saccharopolyspora antimicrobica]SFN01597.1 hypothetical protein SAMN05421805_102248 [Saccharopolyspora antimicrobica]